MWIFTNVGYFSIVQKRGTTDLTVRARCREDLDALRRQHLPELGPNRASELADYPVRASAPHAAVARAMARMVNAIHYPNFKDEVARRQGQARAGIYHDVWEATTAITAQAARARRSAAAKGKRSGSKSRSEGPKVTLKPGGRPRRPGEGGSLAAPVGAMAVGDPSLSSDDAISVDDAVNIDWMRRLAANRRKEGRPGAKRR